MKPVSIHPLSALAGAGLLGLILMASGAAQTPVPLQQIATGQTGLIRVAGIPDPRQMLVIREGTPFVVPAGKLLVITGLGGTGSGVVAGLRVDGVNQFAASGNLESGNALSIRAVPPGFTVEAGLTVEVSSGTPFGRAWGYLVDA